MPVEDILQHQATPVRYVEGEYVEGEPRLIPVREDPFNAVIFLPNTSIETRRGRMVEKPQLMYPPEYEDPPGIPIQLSVGDRVEIIAAEQNLAAGLPEDEEVPWLVDSDPQPLGRPGDEVVLMYCTVRRVKD